MPRARLAVRPLRMAVLKKILTAGLRVEMTVVAKVVVAVGTRDAITIIEIIEIARVVAAVEANVARVRMEQVLRMEIKRKRKAGQGLIKKRQRKELTMSSHSLKEVVVEVAEVVESVSISAIIAIMTGLRAAMQELQVRKLVRLVDPSRDMTSVITMRMSAT